MQPRNADCLIIPVNPHVQSLLPVVVRGSGNSGLTASDHDLSTQCDEVKEEGLYTNGVTWVCVQGRVQTIGWHDLKWGLRSFLLKPHEPVTVRAPDIQGLGSLALRGLSLRRHRFSRAVVAGAPVSGSGPTLWSQQRTRKSRQPSMSTRFARRARSFSLFGSSLRLSPAFDPDFGGKRFIGF